MGLMATLFGYPDQMLVAVWSSMMMHNLMPLVEEAFGEHASDLAFVWDQSKCKFCHVPGMHKPLLRKDLIRLRQSPVGYVQGHVLLIDDDPIKCTANPKGSAVHPASFTGEWDDELLKMSAYLEALVNSDAVSVPAFVLAQPYEDFEVPGRPAASRGCKGPAAKRQRRAVGDTEVGAASDEEWVEANEEGEWEEEGEEETGAAEHWGQESWAGQSWEEATSNQTRAWPQAVEKTDAEMMAEAEQLAEIEEAEAWEDVTPRAKPRAKHRAKPRASQQGPTEEEVQVQIDRVNIASREVVQTGNPWKRVQSKSEPGSYFYFNEETYESSMEPPEPWQKRQSRNQRGVWYYWNSETGATSVEKPLL